MIVVADTTPINYLILIGQEELLHRLFHRIIIPEGVARELQAEKAPQAVRSWAAQPPDWVESGRSSQISQEFPHLGDGERETIQLGLELGAELLLMDERSGRDAARERNLTVAGTLAILDRAADLQLIEFSAALMRLRETSFFISAAVERFFLERDEHRRALLKST